MGIYNPFQKLAVGSKSAEKSASGRLAGRPANDQIYDRCSLPVNRSQTLTARSTEARNREQLSGWSIARSTAWSTGPPANLSCTLCAHRSTVPVDRLLVRSTERSTGRRPGQTNYRDLKLGLFNF